MAEVMSSSDERVRFAGYVFECVVKELPKEKRVKISKWFDQTIGWTVRSSFERPPSDYRGTERKRPSVTLSSADGNFGVSVRGDGAVTIQVFGKPPTVGRLRKRVRRSCLRMSYLLAKDVSRTASLERTSLDAPALEPNVDAGDRPHQMLIHVYGADSRDINASYVRRSVDGFTSLHCLDTVCKQREFLTVRGYPTNLLSGDNLSRIVSLNMYTSEIPRVEGILVCPQVLTDLSLESATRAVEAWSAPLHGMYIDTPSWFQKRAHAKTLSEEEEDELSTHARLMDAVARILGCKGTSEASVEACARIADLALLAVSRCLLRDFADYPMYVCDEEWLFFLIGSICGADEHALRGSLSGAFSDLRERQLSGRLLNLGVIKDDPTRSDLNRLSQLRRTGYATWSNRSHSVGNRRMCLRLKTRFAVFERIRKDHGSGAVFLSARLFTPPKKDELHELLSCVWDEACRHVRVSLKRERGDRGGAPIISFANWNELRETFTCRTQPLSRTSEASKTPQSCDGRRERRERRELVQHVYDCFKERTFTRDDIERIVRSSKSNSRTRRVSNDSATRARMYLLRRFQENELGLFDSLRLCVEETHKVKTLCVGMGEDAELRVLRATLREKFVADASCKAFSLDIAEDLATT
ncbi:hypothetical protein CYMTET_35724 [Cymbomonas tetramitiformis]|uniref:Uncharacterized protein n=1 Tax=Cymbomonas tetramitiformis TaxID=36881 RepID=A0AAE0F8L4_9CHLO|nr:hypothetical protein CYMTET_35724 [Cymbomonas tetramitiformis]|eukprot:gene193-336_t